MDNLNMIAFIYQAGIRLGSERVDNTKQRRVVIIRNGKRVYGSKTYTNLVDLNKAWIRALEYEYNKLISSVTK